MVRLRYVGQGTTSFVSGPFVGVATPLARHAVEAGEDGLAQEVTTEATRCEAAEEDAPAMIASGFWELDVSEPEPAAPTAKKTSSSPVAATDESASAKED